MVICGFVFPYFFNQWRVVRDVASCVDGIRFSHVIKFQCLVGYSVDEGVYGWICLFDQNFHLCCILYCISLLVRWIFFPFPDWRLTLLLSFNSKWIKNMKLCQEWEKWQMSSYPRWQIPKSLIWWQHGIY